MEAAGRQLSNSPLLSTVACAGHLIQNIGTAEQKSALLPQISAGKLILAVAHDEGAEIGPFALRRGTVQITHGVVTAAGHDRHVAGNGDAYPGRR